MISVLVCSIHPEKLHSLAKSLEATIGVPYELLVHDNRNDAHGICDVYNMLASRARYEFLCFVHEDVEFVTLGWGERLLSKAFLPDTGLIGLAGGQYVGRKFISWGDTPGFDHWNIWQWDGSQYAMLRHNPENDEYTPSITLDGVFLFTKKMVWEANPFSVSLPGFHLYDADISLRVARTYKNYVCQWMELRHASSGNAHSESYYKNLLTFQKIHYEHLPMACGKALGVGWVWKLRYEAMHAFALFGRLRSFYPWSVSLRFASADLTVPEKAWFFRYLGVHALRSFFKKGDVR